MSFILIFPYGGHPGRQTQVTLKFVLVGVMGSVSVDVVLAFALEQVGVRDVVNIFTKSFAFVEHRLCSFKSRLREYFLRGVHCGCMGT